MPTPPLQGKVAVVAGATRGCGRAVAIELGAAGATVYCTGRSVRGRPSSMNRPETIEDTADLVAGAGGVGIPVQVDHLEAAQVASLFERVRDEQGGRLDILVNDIWGGDPLADWEHPFWEQPIEPALQMVRQAVHTHLITSRFGVPLMVARESGLVIEVTDGDSLTFRGSHYYDLAKTSVMRLALGMSEEFKQRAPGLTAVAVTPGFLRSEAMLDHFGVTEATWRDAIAKDPYYAESETPRYLGRGVAALAADPNVARWAGQTVASWILAREYGIYDVDGRQPDWGAFFQARDGD